MILIMLELKAKTRIRIKKERKHMNVALWCYVGRGWM